MITLNGQAVASPDSFGVEFILADKSAFNARGGIVTDVLGVKRRVTLGYQFIDAQSLSALFELVAGDVTLTCPDPQEGGQRSGLFICTRRGAGAAVIVDDALWWRDAVIVLTER